VKPVAPFQHADAPFASGAPFLSLLEPALLFQFASRRAPGAPVRDRNLFHSQGLHPFFLYLGVETGIGGDPVRHSAQLPALRFHRCLQPMTVTRSLLERLLVRDHLVLRFLHLHQLAKLVRFPRLPLADDFRARFEQADQLARQLRDSLEDPRLGLPHHAAHPFRHRRASATIRSCNARTVSAPIACRKRTSVFASGTFSVPIRQKLRYTTLPRTSRSRVS